MATEKIGDEKYKAALIYPNGAGKTSFAIRNMIEKFIESGKGVLQVEFLTPEIIDLKRENAELKKRLADYECPDLCDCEEMKDALRS